LSESSDESSGPVAAEVKKKGKTTTIIVFCFVFIIAWMPLVISLTGVSDVDTMSYSLYSEGYNGCSQLKTTLQGEGGFDVRPLISSLSVVNGINRNSVLCVLGPTLDFSIIEASALLDFFMSGSCLIIADDFGSGNRILDNLALLLPPEYFPSMPLLFTRISAIRFEQRLLLDADSNDDGKPLLPAITNFNDGGAIFQTTQRVVMNYATGISGIGGNFTSIASSSTNSWVTSDWDHPAYDPGRGDTAGPFTLIGVLRVANGLLVLVSDPSIFINDMINRADNRSFALELFTYLAGQTNSNTIIIDHNHLAWGPFSPVLYVGLVMGQITYLSTNWLLAPLAPLMAFWMVRRWITFERPKEEEPREVYRLRGQTAFRAELSNYLRNERYDEAIQIMYTQLKRELVRRYSLRGFDTTSFLAARSGSLPERELALVKDDLDALESATQARRRIDRSKFLDLFWRLKRIREKH
jgi:hypothetical protein